MLYAAACMPPITLTILRLFKRCRQMLIMLPIRRFDADILRR